MVRYLGQPQWQAGTAVESTESRSGKLGLQMLLCWFTPR